MGRIARDHTNGIQQHFAGKGASRQGCVNGKNRRYFPYLTTTEKTMLNYRDVPDSNIVEFTVDGHIDRADFDAVVAVINDNITRHGGVRLLEDIKAFGLTDPMTLWEDLKWLFTHFKDIERTAVVSDHGWLEGFIQMTSPMFTMPIRYFKQSDIEQARAWLAE